MTTLYLLQPCRTYAQATKDIERARFLRRMRHWRELGAPRMAWLLRPLR